VSATYGDNARATLRTLVATLEREIALLPPTIDGKETSALRASWSELIQTLALGPAPETRKCPTCNGTGMRDATRCMHCWASLAKLPAELPAVAVG